MSKIQAQFVEEKIPWHQNRKFTTPINGALATIIFTILNEINPLFTVPAEVVSTVIGAIWLIIAGIVFGDIGHDWLYIIFDSGAEVLNFYEEEAEETPEPEDDAKVEALQTILEMLESIAAKIYPPDEPEEKTE